MERSSSILDTSSLSSGCFEVGHAAEGDMRAYATMRPTLDLSCYRNGSCRGMMATAATAELGSMLRGRFSRFLETVYVGT